MWARALKLCASALYEAHAQALPCPVLLSKYKLMESHVLENRRRIKAALPENEKSIAAVQLLVEKQDTGSSLKTHFNLSDNVYASATVVPQDKVGVWLGVCELREHVHALASSTHDLHASACAHTANFTSPQASVMVEYTYQEALNLLASKLEEAKRREVEAEEDLKLLREAIITTEVNMARTFNHDVRARRAVCAARFERTAPHCLYDCTRSSCCCFTPYPRLPARLELYLLNLRATQCILC